MGIEESFEGIVRNSEILMGILEEARAIGLKDYYVGAGCVTQTVWNHLHGFDGLYGIKDIDFVYYNDTSSDLQDQDFTGKVIGLLDRFNLEVDVTNEAKVHLWYESKFGFSIEPYKSVEDAIDTWPTTASSIGIRLEDNGELIVYAPYKINDLMDMIIRPNKTLVTEEIYLGKAMKWQKKWPLLKVVDWK